MSDDLIGAEEFKRWKQDDTTKKFFRVLKEWRQDAAIALSEGQTVDVGSAERTAMQTAGSVAECETLAEVIGMDFKLAAEKLGYYWDEEDGFVRKPE